MFKNVIVSILLIVFLAACVKNAELTPVGTTTTTAPVSVTEPNSSFDLTGQKLLRQGSFVNNVHTVKGTASIYEKDGKRTLVFNNFSTDAGPDLRIYVAEDAALTNFVEISKLTTTGNFFIELPANYSPNLHRAVLIWCKPFSVLFGYATLN